MPSRLHVEAGLGEVGWAAEVAPVVIVGAEGGDGVAFGGEAEIGGNDGECAYFTHEVEDAGRNDVNAVEGKWNGALDGAN